jgi:hypothetical protein
MLSALLALMGLGCSSPCDDLKEQCDACGQASTASGAKALCDQVVAVDDSDSCDAVLESKLYESCP